MIALIGREGELATIDVDGDGAADADLSVLGIDDEDRRRLASLYADGTQLWRVPLTHFSPYDCNWPIGSPATPRRLERAHVEQYASMGETAYLTSHIVLQLVSWDRTGSYNENNCLLSGGPDRRLHGLGIEAMVTCFRYVFIGSAAHRRTNAENHGTAVRREKRSMMEVFTPADLAPASWPAIVATILALSALGIAALANKRNNKKALGTALTVAGVASILSFAQWTDIRWWSKQESAYPECLGRLYEGELSGLDAQGPQTRDLLRLTVGSDTLAFDSTIRVDDILDARARELVGRRVHFCVVDRRHREPTWMTADLQ